MRRSIASSMAAVLVSALSACAQADSLDWVRLNAIEPYGDGYRTTGDDPWMISDPVPSPVSAKQHFALIEMRVSRAVPVELRWWRAGEVIQADRTITLNVQASDTPVVRVCDLDALNSFDGLSGIRIDPGHVAGLEFEIASVRFVTKNELPASLVPDLVGFQCFTSKLHYLPGELIQYRATLDAGAYPDRESSKELRIVVRDANGQIVGTTVQQYGILPIQRWVVVQGVLEFDKPPTPGKYRLEATTTDQRSGLELNAAHEFGVQSERDPYLYETPFRFVKDFSVVRGPMGRWHVFSITGDLFGPHAWEEDGQERTFSHASSTDLRNWTHHPPVISISNKSYPDGQGRFKDRNVWAPHVIEHDGKYWMFYTSVNKHVSQSISLATSTDLSNWTEYEDNPVFTLEGVEWANWARDRWADCRDPDVIREGDRYYLYVTANVLPPGEVGGVVVAQSDDLVHWRDPAIAVRGHIASESPQVWKSGGRFWMTTSSLGAGTYVSDHPAHGWKRNEFPRPAALDVEKLVPTSVTYAEEVVTLEDGTKMIAGLTWRHLGNSIYFFKMKTDESGKPVGYESPFELP